MHIVVRGGREERRGEEETETEREKGKKIIASGHI
jgi:hypothetical protein